MTKIFLDASFIVMQERGLTEALTTDKHFQQAGFIVLLQEETQLLIKNRN